MEFKACKKYSRGGGHLAPADRAYHSLPNHMYNISTLKENVKVFGLSLLWPIGQLVEMTWAQQDTLWTGCCCAIPEKR